MLPPLSLSRLGGALIPKPAYCSQRGLPRPPTHGALSRGSHTTHQCRFQSQGSSGQQVPAVREWFRLGNLTEPIEARQ
jgi:hypothetical protein